MDRDIFSKAMEPISSLECIITVMNHYGLHLEKKGNIYKANCPFHNDKNPSFTVSQKKDKASYYCYSCSAGGDVVDFIQQKENISKIDALKKAYKILGFELNIKPSKLENLKKYINENFQKENYKLENIYIYEIDRGIPVILKIKYRNIKDKSKKDMRTYKVIDQGDYFQLTTKQNSGDYTYTIYNFPEVKKAIENNKDIYIVEGEKDADTLKKLGLTATTIVTKKWQGIYTEQLRDAKVIFIGDTGEAGEKYKNFIWNQLKDTVKSYKIVNLPDIEALGDNKDVTDWLQAGHTKEELLNTINRTLDLLDKTELHQDKKGIYQFKIKKDKSTGEEKEYKDYLTNFKIKAAELLRNQDNGDQTIKLILESNLGVVSEVEGNARECFTDVRVFKKIIGVDYIFTKTTAELTRLQQWIIKYFIVKDTVTYTITGIRKIKNKYVLITNNGTLYPDGIFDKSIKASNLFHNINFENVDVLTTQEANKLAENLFNFNIKTNVYNTLGLGIAYMLNTFARESQKDNLPVLQDIGESNSGKSVALHILNLLYNNTTKAMSYTDITNFSLQNALSNTYLPIFIDEFKPSKNTTYKLNIISNYVRTVTEGYTNFKGTVNQTLNVYEIRGSLAITGEEEMQETAVKNRSNIVWYAKSNFTNDGKTVTDYLKKSSEGNKYLKQLSKSLYLYILNNYNIENFEMMYDRVRVKYNLDKEIESSRECNTAIYTLLGLNILYDVFEDLGVDIDKYLNLDEAAAEVIENIKSNVMDLQGDGAKAEYEIILEAIDYLAGVDDYDLKIVKDVDYKIVADKYVALRIKPIYDKLTKYYKAYKDEKLLNKNTFTKMLGKSKYTEDKRIDYYKTTSFKKIYIDSFGKNKICWKSEKAYLILQDELKKLDIYNILENKENDKFETEVIEFPF